MGSYLVERSPKSWTPALQIMEWRNRESAWSCRSTPRQGLATTQWTLRKITHVLAAEVPHRLGLDKLCVRSKTLRSNLSDLRRDPDHLGPTADFTSDEVSLKPNVQASLRIKGTVHDLGDDELCREHCEDSGNPNLPDSDLRENDKEVSEIDPK
jgi:hypothetical protein